MLQSTGTFEYADSISAEGLDPPPLAAIQCCKYDTKQSDGEVPVMLQLWGMRSTLSLPSLPVLYFDLRPGPKILFQGNTPEGSDTFQRPVIERDRVGGLRLMIWEKVKVPLCHYSDAPEEGNLWTALQLFPLDDN